MDKVYIIYKIVFKWDLPKILAKILADLKADVIRCVYASTPGKCKDISASQLSNS